MDSHGKPLYFLDLQYGEVSDLSKVTGRDPEGGCAGCPGCGDEASACAREGTYKVALASTDGKVVNQHFGRAESFHIFEVSGGGYRYLESRATGACCSGGEHEREAFARVADVLKDAGAVIVSKIGRGASDFLEARGFVVYEAPFPIGPLLDKIVRDRLWETDEWQTRREN